MIVVHSANTEINDRIKFVLKKVGHFSDFILSCMILGASKLVDGVKV